MTDERSKPQQLVEFLQELVQIRSKVTYDISDYEHCLWLANVPRGTKHCSTALEARESESDAWVTVRRYEEPVVPSMPATCAEWIDSNSLSDHSQHPSLPDQTQVRLKLVADMTLSCMLNTALRWQQVCVSDMYLFVPPNHN